MLCDLHESTANTLHDRFSHIWLAFASMLPLNRLKNTPDYASTAFAVMQPFSTSVTEHAGKLLDLLHKQLGVLDLISSHTLNPKICIDSALISSGPLTVQGVRRDPELPDWQRPCIWNQQQ